MSTQEKLESALSSLQHKKEAFEAMRSSYESTAAYIQVELSPPGRRGRSAPLSQRLTRSVLVSSLQVQARFVERQTRAEFEKLHAFLRAEEEARMEALKREEEQRSQATARKLEEITEDIASLSQHIRALEEELDLDGISMLHVSLRIVDRSTIRRSIIYSDLFLFFFLIPSEMQEDASEVLQALITHWSV